MVARRGHWPARWRHHRQVGAAAIVGWLAACASPAFGLTLDHLKCHKIRDSLGARPYAVEVRDGSGIDQCKVAGRASLFCVEAEKTSVVPTPPGGGPGGTPAGHFLCYRSHCRNVLSETLVEDQFGRRLLLFNRARLICAPATIRQ
jgi:hypothetical protein